MVEVRTCLALSVGLALGAAAFHTVPALAQSNTSSTLKLGDKAPTGTLTQTHGDWRASGLVGATVYNDQGNSIGTISDLLLSSDGTTQNAVLSVGGFLGVGSKLVEVPFKNIKFAPSLSNPDSGSKQATQTPASPSTTAQAGAVNGAGAAGTTGSGTPGTETGTPPASASASGLGGTSGTGPGSTAPGGAAGTPSSPASHEYSLVLPGATKASLTSDPEFHY